MLTHSTTFTRSLVILKQTETRRNRRNVTHSQHETPGRGISQVLPAFYPAARRFIDNTMKAIWRRFGIKSGHERYGTSEDRVDTSG